MVSRPISVPVLLMLPMIQLPFCRLNTLADLQREMPGVVESEREYLTNCA